MTIIRPGVWDLVSLSTLYYSGMWVEAASCVNLISGKYHVSVTNIDGRRFRMFPSLDVVIGVSRCDRSRSKP